METDAEEWMRRFEFAARAMPRVRALPFAAVCFECDMQTPWLVGWTHPGPRDRWAVQHRGISGHAVERYNMTDDGVVTCPAGLFPQALGHARGQEGE